MKRNILLAFTVVVLAIFDWGCTDLYEEVLDESLPLKVSQLMS
jgi:hypothetical protein